MEQYVGRGFYASIRAVQARPEIVSLARMVQTAKPEVIVEIGTYKGGTLYIWSRCSPKVRLIVSIDLPDGAYGGGYSPRRQKLYREFVFDRPGAQVEFLQRDSHDPTTLARLKKALAGRVIDFLYIDGDHTYEGVKQDYEMYSPLVRPGGIIAFHDIETRSRGVDVYRLWNELKPGRHWTEFVERPRNKGIGVLSVGQEAAGPVSF